MLRQTARLAARRRATATRAMSTEYAFDEPKSTSNWPRTKANTLINVVPQGEAPTEHFRQQLWAELPDLMRRAGAAQYMRPRQLLARRSLPRGASGKVMKRDLQRELAARSGGDAPAPDRVAGFVIYGDIPDMEYSALIGTFELTPAAALPPSLLGRLPIPSAWGSSLT